jgi:Leucine-rich repeat (LRR) protein
MLSLSSNQLSGPFPDVTTSPHLRNLSLDQNRISGGMPELDLPSLTQLDVRYNVSQSLSNIRCAVHGYHIMTMEYVMWLGFTWTFTNVKKLFLISNFTI